MKAVASRFLSAHKVQLTDVSQGPGGGVGRAGGWVGVGLFDWWKGWFSLLFFFFLGGVGLKGINNSKARKAKPFAGELEKAKF